MIPISEKITKREGAILSARMFFTEKIELNVQSCKWCNNKYMIALTQITNTEIVAFLAVFYHSFLRQWKDNPNLKSRSLFK